MSIFLYRTRLVQSRLVMLGCILLVAWYAVYVAFAHMLGERFDASFSPTPWAALPAIAAIFCYLAFRGIIRDEMLVRSLDRLRSIVIGGLCLSMLAPTEMLAQLTHEQTNIHVGVLLPLKEQSSRGPKMIEFYQGMLMAVDSLRREGLFIDVEAHNCGTTAEEMDSLLASCSLTSCDLIIGPLDAVQVAPLADYCNIHYIRLVQPFASVTALAQNHPRHYVVTAPRDTVQAEAVNFVRKELMDFNYILVDSHEQNEEGVALANQLRYMLNREGAYLRPLDIDGGDMDFFQAFNPLRQNLVAINTPSLKALNKLLPKLKKYQQEHPDCAISLLGFPSWQTYTTQLQQDFHQFDSFVYTPFYRNPSSKKVASLEAEFERWFSRPMTNTFPRYAMMGFDVALYFLGGIARFGNSFEQHLAEVPFQPLHTPLRFVRMNDDSGFVNHAVEFVHYTRQQDIEVLMRTE